MSRSRKKVPVVSDYSRNRTAHYKRIASRAVRHHKEFIPDGCAFKRLYCSYNIFDYKCHWFKSDADIYDHIDIEDVMRGYRK